MNMCRRLFAALFFLGLAAAPPVSAQVLFSDGFETRDASRWTATASNEPITYPVEGCREGRSPCGAMTLPGNQHQVSVLWSKESLRHSGPQFYIGAWFRFPQGYSWNRSPGWVDPETGRPGSTEHKMFIINVGNNVGRVLVNLRGDGNSPVLQTHFESLERLGGISKFSTTPWPTNGGWHHLEVLIDRHSGTTARSRIWLDGNPVLDERGAVCGSPCSPVVNVSVGAFVNQGSDRRQTFLVDDVVIAGSLPSTTSVPSGPRDTTPPTVSLQAPRNGAVVSGTQVQLSANAQDDRGVASVQFQLDGLNLGQARTAAPFSLAWDTTQTSNGNHSLRAVARDGAGNSTTSNQVTVSVNNVAPTQPPGRVGNFRVTRTGSQSVELTFVETHDGANQPAKYEVRQQEGGETLNWGSAPQVRLGSCATPLAGREIGRSRTCTVEGLKPATRYHFQMLAFRGTLDSTSDPATFGEHSPVVSTTTQGAASVILNETFDDSDFSNWYDDTRIVTTEAQRIPGSNGRSAQFHFARGEQHPAGRKAVRHEFATETESVYLRYYVKHSDNWIGSGQNFHPHQFHFLSNREGRWSPLSSNWLNMYVEANRGVPQIQIQDAKNIDQSRINADLTGVTEQRAVGGCNGDSDGHGVGDCYGPAGQKVNGKLWRAREAWFLDQRGPRYKGDWHKVEAYIKLNSIASGRGVADGVIRYYYDDQPVIDVRNALLRTGANAGLRFKEFVMAPYIQGQGERGSPIDQTFWVDELVISTAPPAESAIR